MTASDETMEPVVPAESYVTVEDIRESRVAGLEELPSYFIQKRLNELSRVIDEYCDTRFEPTQAEWRTDLKSKVKVLNTPLISVEEVSVLNDTLIEDEHYYVYPERDTIEIEGIMNYPKRKKALSLRYTYGYAEVPALVKEVLMELFKDSISMLKQSSGRIKSESWEDYTYTLADSTEVVQGMLGRLSRFKKQYEPERASDKVRAMLL